MALLGSAAGFSSIDVTAAGLREKCTVTEVRGERMVTVIMVSRV